MADTLACIRDILEMKHLDPPTEEIEKAIRGYEEELLEYLAERVRNHKAENTPPDEQDLKNVLHQLDQLRRQTVEEIEALFTEESS